MDYKYTIANGVSVVMVEHVDFFKPAKGRVFRDVLSKKFPDSKGEFVITYKDSDGVYHFETPNPTIGDGTILNAILEKDWKNYTWGTEASSDEEE